MGININDSAGSSTVQIQRFEIKWYICPETPQPQISGFHCFFNISELWENFYKLFQRLDRLEQNPGRKRHDLTVLIEVGLKNMSLVWNNTRKHRGLIIWGWGSEEGTVHTWRDIAHSFQFRIMQQENAYYIQEEIPGLSLGFQIWESFKNSTLTNLDFISFKWYVVVFHIIKAQSNNENLKAKNSNL